MFDRVFALGRVRIPAPSSDMPLARRVPEIRWSNPRSPDRQNHGAPEIKPNPDSHKRHLTFEHVSFS